MPASPPELFSSSLSAEPRLLEFVQSSVSCSLALTPLVLPRLRLLPLWGLLEASSPLAERAIFPMSTWSPIPGVPGPAGGIGVPGTAANVGVPGTATPSGKAGAALGAAIASELSRTLPILTANSQTGILLFAKSAERPGQIQKQNPS